MARLLAFAGLETESPELSTAGIMYPNSGLYLQRTVQCTTIQDRKGPITGCMGGPFQLIAHPLHKSHGSIAYPALPPKPTKARARSRSLLALWEHVGGPW